MFVGPVGTPGGGDAVADSGESGDAGSESGEGF